MKNPHIRYDILAKRWMASLTIPVYNHTGIFRYICGATDTRFSCFGVDPADAVYCLLQIAMSQPVSANVQAQLDAMWWKLLHRMASKQARSCFAKYLKYPRSK